MSSERPVLTITRIDSDEDEHTTQLLTGTGPGEFVVRLPDGTTRSVAADTALEACAAVPELHLISGDHSTGITRDLPDLVAMDGLLDGLRLTGEPLDEDEWGDDDAEVFGALYDSGAYRWALPYRITVDDKVVYAVADNRDWATERAEGAYVVPCSDPTDPTSDWRGLLEFGWDSSTYAGPGGSGYGTDGVYLVRPGLSAVVLATDEEITIIPQPVALDADPVTLILAAMHHFNSDRIVAALTGNDPDGVLLPDDEVFVDLSESDVTRLLAALTESTPGV